MATSRGRERCSARLCLEQPVGAEAVRGDLSFASVEEHRHAFDEMVSDDESPWELHEYLVENLEEA